MPLPAAGLDGITGLTAREARVWVELHEAIAFQPEWGAEALRRGLDAEEILARVRRTGSSGASRRAGVSPRSRPLERTLQWLERLRVRVVPGSHPAYPHRLAALVDAPPVLLVRGQVEVLGRPGVAIVGARAATQVGRRTARRMGRELAAQGLTIVSGLARGIDAEAHRGALEAGGRTIAVLACGPDRIYPPEHRRLADEILERGAVISEMPLGTPPRAAHFPLRNRLISGLSLGVIVVEARRRSGSLISVRHALDQGREVFVVPGSVEGPFAEGSNRLLREGARAILDGRDVVEDLGLGEAAGMVVAPAEGGATGSESDPGGPADSSPPAMAIVEMLAEGPLARDELARRAGLEPGVLARALLELELVGRVAQERDGRLHLVCG
ncbi:MAG: DNA-protecting protein DprA [Deltaproteobacteria bacterium]|nr:DNA-protecting protein DprA [Deltaproteobacteria bacterium]